MSTVCFASNLDNLYKEYGKLMVEQEILNNKINIVRKALKEELMKVNSKKDVKTKETEE